MLSPEAALKLERLRFSSGDSEGGPVAAADGGIVAGVAQVPHQSSVISP
jgi:hypothetical protein